MIWSTTVAHVFNRPYWNVNVVFLSRNTTSATVFNRPYWNVNYFKTSFTMLTQSVFNRPYWNVNKELLQKFGSYFESLIVHIGM